MLAAIDWGLIWSNIVEPNSVFARAFWATIYISIVAQALGLMLGLFAAIARMSHLWPLRFLSGVYVWIFRGTPVLVQIFFFYFALDPPGVDVLGISLSPEVTAGILALGINEGAYMREIVRAGIDSIDKGQMEAAKSLGMRYWPAMWRIILPQAARVIVPPLGNEFNNMMKTSSLLYTIGVYELTAHAEQGFARTFKSEYFIIAAFWYLVLTTVWTFVQMWIERRLAASERGDVLTLRERLRSAWNPISAWGRGGPEA